MIEHLSAEQISQWIVGERTPHLVQHVAECAECGSELEQLETALAQFRTAMREPAFAPAPPAWREPAAGSSWYSWPRLVLATAALLVLVAFPVSWKARERDQAAQAALADSQLLESVDSAISQAVPEPMEPLVSLVSWNSSSTDQNQKAQRQ
jgi:cytochrome bd-type quinol oxidase subunit 2